MEIQVYEIKVKLYTLEDIQLLKMQSYIAELIDCALAAQDELLTFHDTNKYKLYCFNGLYPLEKDGVYKKDRIYTVTIRTVDDCLAHYFAHQLCNYYTDTVKGVHSEIRKIPRKRIDEVYTLTPAIVKSNDGYWRNFMRIDQYERRLFENIVKKYNQYSEDKLDENFELYTSIRFLNRKPIANSYKKVCLLGDKLGLKIAYNDNAQRLAYFMLGTGILEMNARGYGYCNYRWVV